MRWVGNLVATVVVFLCYRHTEKSPAAVLSYRALQHSRSAESRYKEDVAAFMTFDVMRI